MAPADADADADAATGTPLRIEVAYSPRAEVVEVRRLQLPAGSVLGDALQASGLLQAHGLVGQELSAGIWGHSKPPEEPLRDRDRVEIYRPLQVDPKEARRLRYKQKPKVKRVLRGRVSPAG